MKEKIILFFKAQSVLKKCLIGAILLLSIVVTGIISLIVVVWTGGFGALPTKEELLAVQNPLATEIYSADSVLLGKFFLQERSNVAFTKIPSHVIDAVISVEDVRFYNHHGIDTKSLFRVLFKSILLQHESSGGGSTLTQQLAKNLYPRRNYAFCSMPINKIREAIVASRFEKVYSKNDILTLYLNTVPFGDNTYGIEAAAQRFFSTTTKSLSIEQGAVLIGMLKASYAYNPRIFPERAKVRRNVVLAQMNKYGKLSNEKKAELQATPIELSYNLITHHSGLAPYFRDYITKELLTWCNTHNQASGEPYNLYTDGLKIYTTINSHLQRYAEQATNTQMASLQKKFNNHWAKSAPWKSHPEIVEEAIKKSDRYKNLIKEGLSSAEIDKIMHKPVMMSVFTWDGEKEMVMSPIDSIKHYLTFLNAGLLAMDPEQGAILAWVGGINHHYFQYDHVRESTKRQVGSTFKPIVYAAALEQGAEPCEFISAEQTVYTNNDSWKPQNSHDNYDMKFSMEGALALSVNTVSVRVLERAGIANTIGLAKRMGITSAMPAVPSLALGTADISMLEMVNAYACFANQGKKVKPFYLTSITTHDDKIIEIFTPELVKNQVLSSDNAQLIIQMLKRTVNEGTASALRSRYRLQNDLAGKTGTTQSNADGWFIAILPKLIIGSWVGSDDPRIRFRSTSLGQGASTALPIVAKLLQLTNADKKLESITQAKFPTPSENLSNRLSCELYKSDLTFLEKIFGKNDSIKRHRFGEEKKKGFFRKLFGKR